VTTQELESTVLVEEKPLWRCHEFPACKRALDSLLFLNVLCVRLEASCMKRQSLLVAINFRLLRGGEELCE